MKSRNRVVLTGAVGSLAAVTVAASGAFACTAQASLSVGDGSGFVEPGQQVQLKAQNFPSPDGEIEILWMDAAGVQDTQVLAKAPAPAFAAPGQTVTIPSTMSQNTTGYYVVARQFSPTAATTLLDDALVTLYRRPASAVTGQQPPRNQTPVTPETPVAPVNPVTATPPAATEATPTAATPAPAPARQATAAPTAATPTAAVATPQPAAAAPAATPAVAAEAQASAPAAPLPKVQPVPAPAELWSGLDASQAPSLLDAPATTTQSSTPVGGILLGAGILALAGVALAVSRRRLALSVATRR